VEEVSDHVVTPERALAAIASLVGKTEQTAPREIFMAVRRIAREHEAMRSRLQIVCDEAHEAKKLLARVDEEGEE
jgi:hypothetical protein